MCAGHRCKFRLQMENPKLTRLPKMANFVIFARYAKSTGKNTAYLKVDKRRLDKEQFAEGRYC